MTTSNNIIMCFDGTDNNFGTKSPSNILELYKMLEKNSPNQHCFYQRMILYYLLSLSLLSELKKN